MPRPTYNGRQVTLYLPSVEDKLRWDALADKAGLPLARWIYETIEHTLDQNEVPHDELIRNLAEMREENRKLREELKSKSILLERQETELYKLRHELFKEVDGESPRQFDTELIAVLKRGTIVGHELLKDLHIDPRDTEATKLLSNQLEILRKYGLVKETASGWRWIG